MEQAEEEWGRDEPGKQREITVSLFFFSLQLSRTRGRHSERRVASCTPSSTLDSYALARGSCIDCPFAVRRLLQLLLVLLILSWRPPSSSGPAQPAVSRVTGGMAGCAKRCKQGLVKFVLSLHRLVTGTLSKGSLPSGESKANLPGCTAVPSAGVRAQTCVPQTAQKRASDPSCSTVSTDSSHCQSRSELEPAGAAIYGAALQSVGVFDHQALSYSLGLAPACEQLTHRLRARPPRSSRSMGFVLMTQTTLSQFEAQVQFSLPLPLVSLS
ncbi:unnamed protein product [Pleuronectes platessa]|uniref:Uncharacterized protein n=1 Tax=Pleuronectes platessa TaxID=8262 RepID=A0A9N7UD74_PLEPL|nr:unnamed protein product [Pleuronectes platessa]